MLSPNNSLIGSPSIGGTRWRRTAWLCSGLLTLALWFAVGCRPQGSSNPPPRLADQNNTGATSEVLYYAIGVLRGMDESSKSDTLNSVVARLNQWIASQPTRPDWKPDPLVASLPADLRRLPTLKTLAELQFAPIDGTDLRQIIWLRGNQREVDRRFAS